MGKGYDDVPWQVQRLQREEEMRDLRKLSENALRLRAEYARMLEDALDAEGLPHWGKPLEWKVRHFEDLAREILISWAKINKIPNEMLEKHEIRNRLENLYLGFQAILNEN